MVSTCLIVLVFTFICRVQADALFTNRLLHATVSQTDLHRDWLHPCPSARLWPTGRVSFSWNSGCARLDQHQEAGCFVDALQIIFWRFRFAIMNAVSIAASFSVRWNNIFFDNLVSLKPLLLFRCFLQFGKPYQLFWFLGRSNNAGGERKYAAEANKRNTV